MINCWLFLGQLFLKQKKKKYRCLFVFLRYTEEETTAAGKPAATGPAAPSSTQRELSDGADETLRDITLGLLCAFKGSTLLQRVTFNIEKIRTY